MLPAFKETSDVSGFTSLLLKLIFVHIIASLLRPLYKLARSFSFLVMLFWEMIVMINKSFLFNILVFVTPKYVYSDLALYSLI